jgi:hypothetical protein
VNPAAAERERIHSVSGRKTANPQKMEEKPVVGSHRRHGLARLIVVHFSTFLVIKHHTVSTVADLGVETREAAKVKRRRNSQLCVVSRELGSRPGCSDRSAVGSAGSQTAGSDSPLQTSSVGFWFESKLLISPFLFYCII